jgi:phosphate transport system substrate-binding protein
MYKKFTVAFGTALLAAGVVQAADISGAGATFPAPSIPNGPRPSKRLYRQRLNYQSIGSGGGIKQIKAKTVDLRRTDAPLKRRRAQKDGLYQFPTVMGGMVPVVNLDGLKPGELKVSTANCSPRSSRPDQELERSEDRS